MDACSKGHVPAVEFLLNNGADPTYKDAYGRTAATLANDRGGEDSKKIGQLLSSSLPPTASHRAEEEGPWINALLFYAVRMGRKDVVEKALAAGVDPNTKDSCVDYSLLVAATAFGHLDIIKMLLKHGANPKAEGNEELVNAAIETGRMDILKCLVEAGAWVTEPNVPCFHGNFLFYAAFNKHPQMVKYLLQHGADPDGESALCGSSALLVASGQGDVKTMELLVAAGADINHRDCQGWSALMHACNKGHLSAVEFLLKNGADPSFRDGYDKTAAKLASKLTGKDGEKIRRLLLEKIEQ